MNSQFKLSYLSIVYVTIGRFAITTCSILEHDKKEIAYIFTSSSYLNPLLSSLFLIVRVTKCFVHFALPHVLDVLFLVSEKGSQMFMVM